MNYKFIFLISISTCIASFAMEAPDKMKISYLLTHNQPNLILETGYLSTHYHKKRKPEATHPEAGKELLALLTQKKLKAELKSGLSKLTQEVKQENGATQKPVQEFAFHGPFQKYEPGASASEQYDKSSEQG